MSAAPSILLIAAPLADAVDGRGAVVSRHRSVGRGSRALARAMTARPGAAYALVVEDATGHRRATDDYQDGRRRVPDGVQSERVNVPVTATQRSEWTWAASRAGVTVAEYVRVAVDDRLAADKRRDKIGLRNPKTNQETP